MLLRLRNQFFPSHFNRLPVVRPDLAFSQLLIKRTGGSFIKPRGTGVPPAGCRAKHLCIKDLPMNQS